jgi:hypothetical protein
MRTVALTLVLLLTAALERSGVGCLRFIPFVVVPSACSLSPTQVLGVETEANLAQCHNMKSFQAHGMGGVGFVKTGQGLDKGGAKTKNGLPPFGNF